MMRTPFLFPATVLVLLAGLWACTSPQAESFQLQAQDQPLSTPAVEARVNALYADMSQEERIAQLHGTYLSFFFAADGQLDTLRCRQLLAHGAGHVSQYASNSTTSPDSLRDQVATLQRWLIDNTPHGIPALFHEEVISGIATRDATVYPQQIGLACSFNPDLATVKTRQTAADMRKIGGMLALSPMVDVVRNPHFNRLEESYGEDAYLAAAMGVAFVRGLQWGGLEQGIAACSKHFLGYGGGGEAADKELLEEILLPHEAMIRVAGSKVVMTGYHMFRGERCVASPLLANGILRRHLGYDGLMVSDYGSIMQVESEPDALHRGAKAINAGNDVEVPMWDTYSLLQEAIDQGLVSQATLEQAVKRVLTLKARLGLLDDSPVLYQEGPITLDTPDERQTAYELATQSVVLLQNNGILPLKGNQKIALTGPNAGNMWAMVGDYTYQGMSFFWHLQSPSPEQPHIVSLREGLERGLPEGCTLAYARGCDWTEHSETQIEDAGDERARQLFALMNRPIPDSDEVDERKALALARESDVIIAAVGENTMLCGENRDRSTLRLPGRQEAFVEQLLATGRPVVLIVFGGRAQVISGLAERCAAVIQAWYPGEEGGNALADIVFGRVNPSGKLCVSYPAVELNEDICYNRAAETDPRVAWPFGYGLSYTTFAYANLQVDPAVETTAEAIHLSFDLTNTGQVAGDEVVQLYLSPTSPDQGLKPIQLCGFSRVSLQPGETQRVSFLLSPQQLGHLTMDNATDHATADATADATAHATSHAIDTAQWTIEPGVYLLKVGASSADIRLTAPVTLSGQTHTLPLRTVYFAERK